MADPNELVDLNGHKVPAARVDEFLHGSTGKPLTDAEWDESKRRVANAENLGEDWWQQVEAIDPWADVDGEEPTA